MSAAVQEQSGKRYTLEKPAIELAVAEVRFRADASVISERSGLAFREILRGSGLALDGLDPVVTQELNIEMTSTGGRATSNSASQGWACRDSTTGLVVTLLPFSVAIQTHKYLRWSETFQPLLTAALAGANELLAPSLRTRIGLRYVNRFVNPAATQPADWSGRFDPALLGPLVAGPLAGLIKGSEQQLEIGWDDGVTGMVRHGAFVDPAVGFAYSYLLDLDVSESTTEPFDPSDCLDRLIGMNRKSAELFRSLLSGSHLQQRGLTIKPDGEAQL